VRELGPVRVLGISTTVMDRRNPRYSTSDHLLNYALDHAAQKGAETKLIRINDLVFRHCEGYYSKSAHACTWPCSITQMDKRDEMQVVYENIVFWCDAVIVSTPIRWGNASSLYYKMIERMNCIQNQITIRNNVLIRNKVASFIITGGQDNIQAVAGQMLMFFSELGFDYPQFPFIAHSRGWSSEDMERNVAYVKRSEELKLGAEALAERTIEKAASLLTIAAPTKTERAGRKAHKMETVEAEPVGD
jgi:multimeric flavodoxin WrbA